MEFDIEAAKDDVENVSNLLDEHSELLEGGPRKLRAVKRCVVQLKEMIDASDTEGFTELYEEKLDVLGSPTDCTNFQQIFEQLREEANPRFSKSMYKVITEKEWNKWRKDGKSVHDIKIQDEIEAEEIEKNVERTFHKDKLCCDPRNIPALKELRIVIIGKTGVGKSATGNLLVGREVFSEKYQGKSSTEAVSEEKTEDNGKSIRILDTPGLLDTKRSREEIRLELAKCFSVFNDGVHAFLYVLNAADPRFTEEEQKAANEAKRLFGSEILNYCVLVFTHFNELSSQEKANAFDAKTANIELKHFIQHELSRRFMFLDNRPKSDYEKQRYRSNLFSMIYQMQNEVDADKKGYTNDIFIDAKQRFDMLIKKEFEIKQNIMQTKFKEFYEALLNVTVFVRNVYHLSCNSDYNSNFIAKVKTDVEREANIKGIKIFSIIHDGLEKICKAILEEEKLYFAEKKFKTMRDSIDLYFKKHSYKLVEEKVSVDSLSTDAINNMSKPQRKHITKEMVDKHISFIIERKLFKTFKLEISQAVFVTDTKIYDKTREFVLKQDLTEENIEKFKKFKNKELAQLIINDTRDQFPRATFDLFSEEELVKVTENKIGEKYAEFEDIAKKSIQKKAPCFPGNAIVYKPEMIPCTISSVKIGDQVLTVNSSGDLQYEDVFFLGHADHTTVSENIVLNLESQHSIILSPTHMIHVGKVGNLIPAEDVQIGDKLFVCDISGIHLKPVIGISKQLERGLFCPHTPSGSIVVNSVVASCYTQNFSPYVAHIILSGINVLYKWLPHRLYSYLYGRDRNADTPRLLEILKPYVL